MCGAWDEPELRHDRHRDRAEPGDAEGWGIRPYDWQFGASVQQEMLPRVSAEISYNRRSWGNFFFTDNRAIGPQDFDKVTFTAPSQPDLPNGGSRCPYALLKHRRSARGQLPTRSRATTAT